MWLFVRCHVASKCSIQCVMSVFFSTSNDIVKTEDTGKMKKHLPE